MGREDRRRETLAAAPLAGFAATRDRDDPPPVDGTPPPPPLAHWLYFLPA